MSNFYDKLFGFLKGNNEKPEDSNGADSMKIEDLKQMIDTSWAGYSTK